MLCSRWYKKGILCGGDEEVKIFKEYTPKDVISGVQYFIGIRKCEPKSEAHKESLEKIHKACQQYIESITE